MFLLVLFALVNLAVSEPPCSKALHTAQNSFNDALNITGNLDWQTVDKLRTAVEQKFAQNGALGLRDVCLAFHRYRTMLSNDFDYCFRVVALISDETGHATGVTRQQAYDYFSLMTQLDYACGGGFEIFANSVSKKDDCMAKTFVSQAPALKACRDTFFNKVQSDPADVCGYATDITQFCYQPIFANCGDAAGFFGCEYARVGVHVHYPQCTDVFCIANHHF